MGDASSRQPSILMPKQFPSNTLGGGRTLPAVAVARGAGPRRRDALRLTQFDAHDASGAGDAVPGRVDGRVARRSASSPRPRPDRPPPPRDVVFAG